MPSSTSVKVSVTDVSLTAVTARSATRAGKAVDVAKLGREGAEGSLTNRSAASHCTTAVATAKTRADSICASRFDSLKVNGMVSGSLHRWCQKKDRCYGHLVHHGTGRAVRTIKSSTYSFWVWVVLALLLKVSCTEFSLRIELVRKLMPAQDPRWTPSTQKVCAASALPGTFSLTQNSTWCHDPALMARGATYVSVPSPKRPQHVMPSGSRAMAG